MNLIDQIVEEGCLWLLITGGEPLIREDFLKIYSHAKRKGLLITLFTNGTLVSPTILNYLAEYPPFETEITIYGRTRETYEQITGIPGSHQHCYQTIDYMIKHKIPLRLKTMLLRLNQHEICDMKAFAEERELEFRYDPMINKRIDGTEKIEGCKLTPEEIIQFEKQDEKLMTARHDFWNRSKELSPPIDYLYLCGAGTNNFHIDFHGNLSLCIMARYPSYNLRKGSFHEGWTTFIPAVRGQKRHKEIPCCRCETISLCDHCPGWAHIETGDPEEWVEYLCKTAHLRAYLIMNNSSSLKYPS